MHRYFHNKIIWLTGASSGIGEALTHALAGQGSRLILSSRKKEELERVAAQSGIPTADVLIVPLDLADYKAMPSLVQQVIDRFGRIDILINNGGISQRGNVLETDIEVDRQLMAVNFTGTVALIKAVLPGMAADTALITKMLLLFKSSRYLVPAALET